MQQLDRQRLLSRRRFLGLAAAGAAAWQLAPWPNTVAAALSGVPPSPAPVITPTLEAFSDTMIPGVKRWPGDRAVAGVAPGAGAVQAGAIQMMNFPPAGISPALPAFAALLTTRAEAYATEQGIVLDPIVPALVALDFDQRTALLLELLDPAAPDSIAWFALSAMPFLAYHTAGYVDTATAMREGHPGLKAIGFPEPDADGLWRFPVFSYGKRLADELPLTSASGSPP